MLPWNYLIIPMGRGLLLLQVLCKAHIIFPLFILLIHLNLLNILMRFPPLITLFQFSHGIHLNLHIMRLVFHPALMGIDMILLSWEKYLTHMIHTFMLKLNPLVQNWIKKWLLNMILWWRKILGTLSHFILVKILLVENGFVKKSSL